MKIFKLNNDGSMGVTLPKQIVTGYGWKPGDRLGYKIKKEGEITLFRKKFFYSR